MHNNLNLARQPILDRDENIVGYEFFTVTFMGSASSTIRATPPLRF
jgi:hypothetical protein